MSDYKCRKGVEYSSHYNLRKSEMETLKTYLFLHILPERPVQIKQI